jgi:type VI secretion system secreted protein Hcp
LIFSALQEQLVIIFLRTTLTHLVALGLFACAMVLVPSAAHAALDAYAVVFGETQGEIGGDVDIAGREGQILIKAFGSSVSVNFDPQTGVPGTGRQHRPIRLLKNMDSASPKLLEAFKNNERLTSITLRFYRPTSIGSEQNHVTIVLENARIVGILPGHSSQSENDLDIPFRETISLTYEAMTVTWEPTGVSTQIDW